MAALFPQSFPRQRLQSFADACEEWARRCEGNGRGLYHLLATEAREIDRARLGDGEMLAALSRLSTIADAAAAHWLGAEPSAYTLPPPALALAPLPAPCRPPDAMNARQLAGRLGMTERTARRWIDRGARHGLPGFYRDGRHLLADPDAFAHVRIMSERPGDGSPLP